MNQPQPEVECEITAAIRALDHAAALLRRYQALQSSGRTAQATGHTARPGPCTCGSAGSAPAPPPARHARTLRSPRPAGHGDPGE